MRNEYPRPDFARSSFVSLDEEWDFAFDDGDVGHEEKWFLGHDYEKAIEVPFAFESRLSGIGDTHFHDQLWYRKTLQIPALRKDEDLVLHFEGVDYYSEVYVNGMMALVSEDGNCGYEVVATPFLKKGGNEIVVYCFDPCEDRSIPRGKQDWEEQSHGIWYTRTSGLYKPVWYEIVNKKRIARFYLTTKLDKYEVRLALESTSSQGRLEAEVSFPEGKKSFSFPVIKKRDAYLFALPNDLVNDRLWSPETPFLFPLRLCLYDEKGLPVDEVASYLAFREIKTKKGQVLLNGRPIYQKLVLDQGYYPEGILTAPSLEAMERDIAAIKAMGFNGVRIHQKIEDPYFLYLCDKKGLLVWQECPATYGYDSYAPRRLLNEWISIVKSSYNHPSIVAYTPLNESWGVEGIPFDAEIQAHALSLYYLIHSLDSSRLVISNDGWEQCRTDLLTVHNYRHGEKGDKAQYQRFKEALSTRESIVRFNNIQRFILNPGYEDEGQPIILSEFGGVAFQKDTGGKAWGYTVCADGKDYEKELRRIYKAIALSKCLVGICYTQFTDVEQEVNGLLTDDRKFKIDPSIIREINDSLVLPQGGRK
jgi:beta-galactosidase/beta-glucuronidase